MYFCRLVTNNFVFLRPNLFNVIQQKTIQLVIDNQREQISHRGIGMERKALSRMDVVPNFATIVSGIRRCGKSVLLTQIMKKTNMRSLFLNFDICVPRQLLEQGKPALRQRDDGAEPAQEHGAGGERRG